MVFLILTIFYHYINSNIPKEEPVHGFPTFTIKDEIVSWIVKGKGPLITQYVRVDEYRKLIHLRIDEQTILSITTKGEHKWRFVSDEDPISNMEIDAGGCLSVSTGKKIISLSPEGLVLWEMETDKQIEALLPARNGLLYTLFKDGGISCFDKNGKRIWNKYFSKESDVHFGGIDIHDRLIVLSQSETVYCLDKSGEILWEITLPEKFRNMPHLGRDASVYVFLDKVYCISPEGQLAWIYNNNDNDYINYITTNDNGVLLSKAGGLTFLDKEGNLIWEYNHNWQPYYHLIEGRDGTIYLGGKDNSLIALNGDCTVKWTRQTEGVLSSNINEDKNGNIYYSIILTDVKTLNYYKYNWQRTWVNYFHYLYMNDSMGRVIFRYGHHGFIEVCYLFEDGSILAGSFEEQCIYMLDPACVKVAKFEN